MNKKFIFQEENKMAVINEIICTEADGSLSFGNYKVAVKQKKEGFAVGSDVYKVRTHKDVTRLSKNGTLVLETVPGAAVHSLKIGDRVTTFDVEGRGSTMITLELLGDSTYSIYVDDVNLDKVNTNMTGKISFSVELDENAKAVRIEKH